MRIKNRLAARATAAAVVLAASLGIVGAQAAGTASAATGTAKKAPKITACATADTKLTVKDVRRPINHLLLKATNTGDKTCNVYYAPYLRMGADAQAPTFWLEDSKPQAVVTLAPGESAYAGIRTSSPEGEPGGIVKKMGVLFSGKAVDGGSVGKEKTLKLPNGGVFVDTSAFVTYWQYDAADALAW